jgi:hypothetical protein
MADIGKVLNLAARVYLARKDSGTGGIKTPDYAPTNTRGGLGSIAKNIGINMGTNALMSKLGLAALGPLGMLLSPFVSKFIGNKFSGLGLNPGGGGGGKPNFPTLTQKQIYDRDDVDPADRGTTAFEEAEKEFQITGDNDVFSGLGGNTNQTYSTPAPSYSYAGSDEEDKDNEGSSNSSSSSSSASPSQGSSSFGGPR